MGTRSLTLAALMVVVGCGGESAEPAVEADAVSDAVTTVGDSATSMIDAAVEESSSPDAVAESSTPDSTSDSTPIVPISTEGDGDYVEAPPYMLGPDSMVKAGVPQGTTTKYSWTSKVFPGTTRDYWVYVPKQYVAGKKTAVMVLQDGANYMNPTGNFRTTVVLDNLIAAKELPPIIAVFISPVNRSAEYDSVTDQYSKLIIDEILPEVAKKVTISDDPELRGIGGHSSGGICAFTVGWFRPDSFRRILTHNGSFVSIRGGDKYPSMIAAVPAKPLRVFLLSGTMDLNNMFGSWADANKKMAAALKAKSYRYRFVFGEGSHTPTHAGANLPATLKWLWRGAPM